MTPDARTGFQEESYRRHAAHFDDCRSGGEQEARARTWFDTDTVDAWRHRRFYETLLPIITTDPSAKWLTIGDGRYGKDAHNIIAMGGDALATDISDTLLREGKAMGYIRDYRRENAEALSFPDGSFDYVLCKESYHHFPRPMLALYEMLRVARKGIFFIEPNDHWADARVRALVFRRALELTKRLMGRGSGRDEWEVSGNYVYSISRRELEKVALGLNYPAIAFLGLNDDFIEGAQFEKLSASGPLQKKIRRTINVKNILCRLGILDYALLAAVIFKTTPSDDLIRALRKSGFTIRTLPRNPYSTP